MKTLPLGPAVRVIKTDPEGLIALDKPEGIRSHPNAGKADPHALLTVPYDGKAECYTWKLEDHTRQWLYLLHRLDAPTSGVILTSLDERMAGAIRKMFSRKEIRKTYYAVVKGDARSVKEQIWKDSLEIAKGKGGIRVSVTPKRGSPALTWVDCCGFTANPIPLSLLKLIPATGRPHQLRVQCASRHLPIAGDLTYGDFAFNKQLQKDIGVKRLMLHAEEILLPFPGKDKTFRAFSSRPDEFNRLIPV